ncbi:sulfurtransferase/chromate resistance protein [Epibacterium ulvae]|uniref:chromate resistance protein ChrB domain-containing protein n=1 Tax=Epibacterium ulvae TaxID=1156985 RepID=UPI001BFC0C8E|nr:sulfurtransferase/chromate resistance protein [Epibacterium ulvae]MBT8154623.1 sulfurtransferase/chromate resistance protein [Epibacterium ulvae]
MPAPNEMTPKQLMRLIGTPECPVIVDVTLPEDVAEDPFLIPGALPHVHTDMQGLITLLFGRPAVIVCQKGKKLSQGVAAWLASEGVAAEYLQGGNLGWAATDGAPRVPLAAIPPKQDGATVWVTRHRPKIDRIACPWLIRRFVDPQARFLFVSPSEVKTVADRFSATPFDVEDVFWSHRGEFCTFDTMVGEFGLTTHAMDRLAQIVRAADTNRHDLAPQAAGLLALSVGLSRRFKDDQQQMLAGFEMYDALYRWARDGFDEGHDWPTTRG